MILNNSSMNFIKSFFAQKNNRYFETREREKKFVK